MMGRQSGCQSKLFYCDIDLEKRIPQNHILRRIKERIDFDFIYAEVRDSYGENGNVSVPPPVIVKMMLLLVLYNVRSERELMDTIPLRLDWLWFLGYDLDSEVPNHSVLSKARARWGVKVFRSFFERIVWQCVEAGLVGGDKLFLDASLIDANASRNSVVDTHSLKRHLNKSYRRFEERLDDLEDKKTTPANSRYVSPTDPDATVTRRKGEKSKLRYKTHRAVDPTGEVITATEVTGGSRDEGDLLKEMIDTHQHNTHRTVTTVVGDSRYGTIENFLVGHDLGIRVHSPPLEQTQRGSGRQKDIFPRQAFIYNPHEDTYSCPSGQILRKRGYFKKRRHYEYKAPGEVCASCGLRPKCTHAKEGRTLKRHVSQDALDIMLKWAQSQEARRDIKVRHHLMERSFAHSTRFGFKRARWRRLWRVQIQDFLIASVQNIRTLIGHSGTTERSNALACSEYLYADLAPKRLPIWRLICQRTISKPIEATVRLLFSLYLPQPAFR